MRSRHLLKTSWKEKNHAFTQDGDKVVINRLMENGSASNLEQIAIIVIFPFDKH
jgi:hypothetical protein